MMSHLLRLGSTAPSCDFKLQTVFLDRSLNTYR